MDSSSGKIIGLDFDGTCVLNAYPKVGEELPYVVDVLRDLKKAGHHLILITMRQDVELLDAVRWFKERNIELLAVNKCPHQDSWSKSRKIYADLYIDDQALGVPLVFRSGSPSVNWWEIRKLLEERNIL